MIKKMMLLWISLAIVSKAVAYEEVKVAVIVAGVPQLYRKIYGHHDGKNRQAKGSIFSLDKMSELQISVSNTVNSEIFFKKFPIADNWLNLKGDSSVSFKERKQINGDYYNAVESIEEKAIEAARKSVLAEDTDSAQIYRKLTKEYASFVSSFQPTVLLVYSDIFSKINNSKRTGSRYTYIPLVWPSQLLGIVSKENLKEDYEFYKEPKAPLGVKQQLFLDSLKDWIEENAIQIVDFNINLNFASIYKALLEHHSLLSFSKEKLREIANIYLLSNQRIFEELAAANPKVIFVHNSGFNFPKGQPLLGKGWQSKKRPNVVSTLMFDTAKIEDGCGVFINRSSNIKADVAVPGFYRLKIQGSASLSDFKIKSEGVSNTLLISELVQTIAKKNTLNPKELLEYFYKQKTKTYFALRGKVESERGIVNVGNVAITATYPLFPEAYMEKCKQVGGCK